MHQCHSMFIFICFCSYCEHFVTKKTSCCICMSFFLHICNYLTFDLTVTLNQKIMFGIYPYIVCNSPRNNSSLDAEH